jgi:hypothetical protein
MWPVAASLGALALGQAANDEAVILIAPGEAWGRGNALRIGDRSERVARTQ